MINTKLSYKAKDRSANKKSVKKSLKKKVTKRNKRKIRSRNKSRIKKGGMEAGQDDTGDKMNIKIEWIDETRNNFSIEVKSDDTIHDSILNNP